jgi:transposase
MNISPGYVGIDISKTTLDVFDAAIGRCERIDNASEPIAALVERWRTDGSFVLFEATGAYDRLLREALGAAKVPFARVNPTRARDFARAAGFLAKTDAIDARMLAVMAERLRPEIEPAPSPARERLVALNRRRDQLVTMRAQETARMSEAETADERCSMERHLAYLAVEIAGYERKIAQQIAEEHELAEARDLLRSVPGVGPVTATVLLALLPELGRRSPKAIAALAGLAPLNRDSGRFRGKRSIAGGRKRVRDALYMAAFVARRYCPRFKAKYEAMIAAGKARKVAIIAIARQLLVTLNAMIRDRVPYAG